MEKKKEVKSASGDNIRAVVNFIKERGIQKDDILFIDKEKGQYTLVYFE